MTVGALKEVDNVSATGTSKSSDANTTCGTLIATIISASKNATDFFMHLKPFKENLPFQNS
jgi:hypothetical protein